MRDTSLLQLAQQGRYPQRYRVSLLCDPQVDEAGVLFRDERGSRRLEWSAVQAALAAEVGEPEGIRTVVFDLVVDAFDAPQGRCYAVYRLDAEPGAEALALATAIARAIGPAAGASIKSLAAEGVTSSRYPDLEEFESAALESLSNS